MSDENSDTTRDSKRTLTDGEISTERKFGRRSFLTAVGTAAVGGAAALALGETLEAATLGQQSDPDSKRQSDPDAKDAKKRPDPDARKRSDPDSKRRSDPDAKDAKKRSDPDAKKRSDPDAKKRSDPDSKKGDPDKKKKPSVPDQTK